MGVAALRGKRVDSRASPEPVFNPVNPNLFEQFSPKNSNDLVKGVEEGEEEGVEEGEEEVVDDAEEVC